MKAHVIQTLKILSKNGKEVSDSDIIEWANLMVARGGKNTKMSSFRDVSLRNGIFFIDLLNGIKKGSVNYELVTNGVSEQDAKMNAMYAISIARKFGCAIFLLPEDIVEVKPKMIMTFVGTLMGLNK